MGFKTSKFMTGMKKSTNFKTLSVAALASIATVSTGVNAAQAADAPITPTLTDSSAYTLTNVSSQADNTITKYTYNESTGMLDKEYFRYDLSKTEYGTGTNSRYYKWVDDKMVRIEADASGNPTETPELTFKYNSTGVQWRPNNQYVYGDYVEQTGSVLDGWGSTSSPFDCKGVQANFVDNAATWGGGHGAALRAFSMAKYGDITGTFIGNHSVASGGAIYNYAQYTYDPTDAYAQIGDITGDFIGNYVNDVTGDFMNHGGGGAIFNSGIDNTNFNISIGNINGNFIRNYTTSESFDQYGGAIQNMAAEIGNITGDFVENYNSVSGSGKVAKGGAIYNGAINAAKGSTIGDIKGDFIGNYATSTNGNAYGGAIYNAFEGAPNNSISINSITGNFYNNSVTATAANGVAFGSAIYNNGHIGAIFGDFIDNTVNMGTFDSYDAAPNAGAIHNLGTIDSIKGSFAGNKTNYSYKSSGNVYSNSRATAIYNAGSIGLIDSVFYGNDILNEGTIDNLKGTLYSSSSLSNLENGTIQLAEVVLDKSSVQNSGTIQTLKGDFLESIVNNDGDIVNLEANFNDSNVENIGTINNFIGSATGYYGHYYGVVKNVGGTIDNLSVDFNANVVDDSFSYGAAIYNTSEINNITGDFTENYVSAFGKAQGGAIYNDGTVDNVTGDFTENYAQTTDAGSAQGGAIYNGRDSQIDNINSKFSGNYVKALGNGYSYGGAIYNEGAVGSITGNFTGNYAQAEGAGNASGGAVYNYDRIDSITGDFTENYAQTTGSGSAYGGAIYNDGNGAQISNVDANFIGNYAQATGTGSAYGGAVYNAYQAYYGVGSILDNDTYSNNYAKAVSG
ncbi:hypothetical protein IJ472_05815, partial [bacterium]|nr:hypothetical protein [bacterium]